MRTARLGALAALLVGLAGSVSAQSADASVSDRRLAVGEQLTYTLTIRGGRGGAVVPPTASGSLRLLTPRPTLDVTTTFNGETERRVAWLYQATQPGTGRLGSLRLGVGGRTVIVGAIEVDVTQAPASPPPSSASSELFVRAELSRREAYVGQQVVVEYVLYFQPNLQPRQTAPIGTWDAAGFWREEMEVPSTYPRAVTLGGEPYEAVTIRRVALFPTRAGTLELAPMRFNVDLLRLGGGLSTDPFGPFFSPFSSRYDEEEVTAPAATIRVEPLPPDAPDGFAGAVGQFELETDVSGRQVEAGEAVEVRVTLSGTGNTATVEAPDLEVPRGVDAYAPRAEREVFRTTEPLRGVATFTYTLVPQGGGVFEVPPTPWTYFDPADGRYKTLRTEAVEITALGPSLAEAVAAVDPNGPAGLILTAPDWERPGSVGWLWVALGGGLALPALAGLGLLAARAGRRRFGAESARSRRRHAAALRRSRLGAARALDGPAAAAEAERAVHAALADRLGVPAATLPHDALADRLDGALDDALRDRTLDLLDACQRAQYAPGLPGTPDAPALVNDAEALLADLASAPRSEAARP